jgi:hypothetical protein
MYLNFKLRLYLKYNKFQLQMLISGIYLHKSFGGMQIRINFKLTSVPFGIEIPAPSRMACASSKSSLSAASVAAFSAFQISCFPSKAGAVSQNSSRLD